MRRPSDGRGKTAGTVRRVRGGVFHRTARTTAGAAAWSSGLEIGTATSVVTTCTDAGSAARTVRGAWLCSGAGGTDLDVKVSRTMTTGRAKNTADITPAATSSTRSRRCRRESGIVSSSVGPESLSDIIDSRRSCSRASIRILKNQAVPPGASGDGPNSLARNGLSCRQRTSGKPAMVTGLHPLTTFLHSERRVPARFRVCPTSALISRPPRSPIHEETRFHLARAREPHGRDWRSPRASPSDDDRGARGNEPGAGGSAARRAGLHVPGDGHRPYRA